MIHTDTDQLFISRIHAAIADSVSLIAEEEAKKASAEIERRVRQEVGAIAIRVAQWADIRWLENRLVIEVKMDEFKQERP